MPPTAKHVLCVSDDADVCTLLTTWLAVDGYVVTTAGGPGEALASVARERFDLIVIDERSPGEVALGLCRAFRSLAPSTPVLLCSGNPYEPTREQATEAGARELLILDGDMGKLVGAARRLTDGDGG